MKKNKAFVLAGVLFFGLIVCIPDFGFTQGPDKSEIIERVRQLENAYNAADAEAYAAIYALNGSHTYANGVTHRGRKKIEEGLLESFAGPMKGTQMKITPQVIQFVTDNIAVEEASFVLTGLMMPDGTEVPAIHGVCLAVYQKQEKDWFAFAVQCMVPPSH
ncbi:MAG: SgcJ/EcaC family oxidoreductase [Bacteroidales bacterium]